MMTVNQVHTDRQHPQPSPKSFYPFSRVLSPWHECPPFSELPGKACVRNQKQNTERLLLTRREYRLSDYRSTCVGSNYTHYEANQWTHPVELVVQGEQDGANQTGLPGHSVQLLPLRWYYI